MITSRPSGKSSDEWTTTVTELIALTQKRRLLWRKDDSRFPGFDVPSYTAEFQGNVLRFGRRLPQDDSFSWSKVLSGYTATVYQLEIKGPSGGLLTSCPPIAALNGLAIAIQRDTDLQEASLFEGVHRAAQEVSG